MKQVKKILINTIGIQPLFYLLLLSVILTGISSSFIIAGTITESLQIDPGSLQLVGRNRAGRTHLDYVYTINIHNNGTKAANNVSAQVSSSQTSAELTETLLNFGDVASAATVTSQNGFVVRVPRRVRVDKNALQFTVSGSFINQAPTANAGPDQNAFIGDTAQLDGSASSDTDGDQLQYLWTFISIPQSL